MAGRVVHSFFADGRQYAAAGGSKWSPLHSRCAIYNGRRVRSLLAPIYGKKPFIHEWHGEVGYWHTRIAQSEYA